MQYLEDRLAPASSITVVAGPLGAGDQDANLTADGQILFADPNIGGNTLSTGALASIAATNNVVVQSTGTITFNDLGDTLSLQTRATRSVTFSTAIAGGGSITFNNPSNTLASAGGSFQFSAATNLTLANLNANGGDVTLSAGNNAAGNLSAQSILTGSGNLTLQATNLGGGTITQSGSATGLAVNATATGNIIVDSLRGTAVALTSTSGAIASFGASPVEASTQLRLMSATGITLNTLTADLQASNSTAADISIAQAGNPPQVLTITGSGVINSAAGGAIAITSVLNTIVVDAVSTLQSNNGAIALAAADLDLAGTVHSGTARTTLTTSIPGRPINLGSSTSGDVGLTDAELDHVSAGVLQIGSVAAGAININAVINPAASGVLTLIADTFINEGPGGILQVGNLRVSANGRVTLANGFTPSANQMIGTIAANVAGSFSLSTHIGSNTAFLTVGAVDGVTGLTSSGGAITLTSDGLEIQEAVSAGSGRVILQPLGSFGGTIDLGAVGEAGLPLALSDAELDRVTADVLQIGSGTATAIDITAAITAPPGGYSTLSLSTAGDIQRDLGGFVVVPNLALRAGSAEVDSVSNDVDVLAAAVVGGNLRRLSFADADSLTIGSVDGLDGLGIGAGSFVSVSAHNGGMLTVTNTPATNDINAPASTVVLTADDMDLQPGSVTNSGTASISLGVRSSGRPIAVGTNAAGALGLTDAELDTLACNFLRIGGDGITGNIILSGAVAPAGPSFLQLRTSEAIVDGTTGEQTDLTIDRLEIFSGTGIGSADELDIAVANFAARNTAANNIRVANTGPLTVRVPGINAAPGALTDLSVASPTRVVNIVLAAGSQVADTAPSGPGLLNTGNLELSGAGSSFNVQLGANNVTSDQSEVTGSVNITGSTLNVAAVGGFRPALTNRFVLISNDGSDAVIGTFNGLPEGTLLLDFLGSDRTARITYKGGDGNDIVILVNRPPLDIALSNSTVGDDWQAGALVGIFSTADFDSGDTHTYALVAGPGDTDNASFRIVSGPNLVTAAALSFEVQSTYSIRVRSTDRAGEFREEVFTITVRDRDENLRFAAGDNQLFVLSEDGNLRLYRHADQSIVEGPTFATFESKVVVASVGDGNPANDVAFVRQLDGSVWLWDQSTVVNTSGFLPDMVAGDGQIFGVGFDHQVWRYRVSGTGSGWTKARGTGLDLDVGSDGDGDPLNDIVFLRDFRSRVWAWDQIRWTNTGGFLPSLVAGDDQLFAIGFDNRLWRYRLRGEGAGWLSSGLVGRDLDVGGDGDGDPMNDLVYFRDFAFNVWTWNQTTSANSGGKLASLAATDSKLFGVSFDEQAYLYRPGGPPGFGWRASGRSATHLTVAGRPSGATNDLAFLLGLDNRFTAWDEVAFTNTGLALV